VQRLPAWALPWGVQVGALLRVPVPVPAHVRLTAEQALTLREV
jgi:hypothetical protein